MSDGHKAPDRRRIVASASPVKGVAGGVQDSFNFLPGLVVWPEKGDCTMPQMIFVNLPVGDLPAAMGFYGALGFSFNPEFTDNTAACMVISDTIFAMLLTHAALARFCDLPVADASKTVSHLLALNRDDRAGVDAMIRAALAAGGSEPRPAQDHGFMYSRAFADLDGHIWEPFFMDMDAMRAMKPA